MWEIKGIKMSGAGLRCEFTDGVVAEGEGERLAGGFWLYEDTIAFSGTGGSCTDPGERKEGIKKELEHQGFRLVVE